MTSRVDFGLEKNWYGLYDSGIQGVLNHFKTFSPNASNIVDTIGQPISGSGTEDNPFLLRQTNFDHGAHRILTPGYYKLTENILFAPNASVSSSTAPTYDSQIHAGAPSSSNVLDNFRPLKSQRAPGGMFSSSNWVLGFFAGITIEPNASGGVVLDMNNKTFEAHTLFNLQQRFYAHIELASGPFLGPQGPGTGIDSKAGHNIWIKNGKFGLGPHHAIHGNSMTNVILENLTIMNNEIAGIALNGGKNILLRNIMVSHNSRAVAVNSFYSHAMFMRESLQILANMDANTYNIESYDENTSSGQKGTAYLAVNASNVVSIGGGRGLKAGLSVSGVIDKGDYYEDGNYALIGDTSDAKNARAYVKATAGGISRLTLTNSGSGYQAGETLNVSGIGGINASNAKVVSMTVDGGGRLTHIADKKNIIANLEETLINDVYIPVSKGINVSNTLFALDSASNTRVTVAGEPREVMGERLIDGAFYGIILNGRGVAVNDFAKNRDAISDNFGDNIVLHNITLNNLKGLSREVVCLSNVSNVSNVGRNPTRQSGVAGEVIRYLDITANGSGTYLSNPVADGWYILTKYNASAATPNVSKTQTTPNVSGLDSRSLNNNEYFMMDWVESASATETNDPSQLTTYVGPNALEKYNLRWINLHDTMFHVMKGNVAFFCDGVQNIRVKHLDICNVENLDPGGDDDEVRVLDYNNMINGSGTGEGLTFKQYQGAAQRGIAVTGSNRITISDANIFNLRSKNGVACGIDVINSCSGVHFKNIKVRNILGSSKFEHIMGDRIFQSGFSVASVAIDTNANPYTGTNQVVFSASGSGYSNFGVGARASASGTISGETLTLANGGRGYGFPPAISIKGGSAGNATATVSNEQVTAITIDTGDAGSGYSSAPEVIISGGGEFASGATATVALNSGSLGTFTITNGGTGYTEAPTVSFKGGGYSTFAATMTTGAASGVPEDCRLPTFPTPLYRPDGYNAGLINPNPETCSKSYRTDDTTHTNVTFDISEIGSGTLEAIPNNVNVNIQYP